MINFLEINLSFWNYGVDSFIILRISDREFLLLFVKDNFMVPVPEVSGIDATSK